MSKETETPAFHIPTLAVLGVGLIGGSLALALRRGGHVGRVIGGGSSLETLHRARRMGVIDEVAGSLREAAQAADVIVLAAPVCATEYLLRGVLPAMTADKVVTDVGSVKNWVCLAARAELGAHARRFVAGHPVAGREHSGVRAAHGELFDGQNIALTPAIDTDADAVELVRDMWTAAGAARVIRMRPAVHDRVLALTSHLPHIVAYAMVDAFAQAVAQAGAQAGDDGAEAVAQAGDDGDGSAEAVAQAGAQTGAQTGDDGDDGAEPVPDVGLDGLSPELYGDMAAGGFYDITRTASSDPVMWRDICVANRNDLLYQLSLFAATLGRLCERIGLGESAALERQFADASETRAQLGERRPTPPRPTLLFSHKVSKAFDLSQASDSPQSSAPPKSPKPPKSS